MAYDFLAETGCMEWYGNQHQFYVSSILSRWTPEVPGAAAATDSLHRSASLGFGVTRKRSEFIYWSAGMSQGAALLGFHALRNVAK